MYQAFTGGLGGIALAKHGKSRAINAENPHGEKGRGGMAASHLGPSRKGSHRKTSAKRNEIGRAHV